MLYILLIKKGREKLICIKEEKTKLASINICFNE